jgi:hypothetical protein
MTEAELVEIRRRYLAGETTYSIAKDFGVTGPTIGYYLKKSGVSLRSRGTQCGLSWEQKTAKVVEMYHQDKTDRQIREVLGIGFNDIVRICQEQGLPSKVKRKLLTPQERVEVARRYKAGENYQELQKAFGGVSCTVIQAALQEHNVKPRVGWSKYRTVCWTDRKGRNFIFKSTWEKAYAKHLDFLGLEWEYETTSYPLEICRRYTPDFCIYEGDKVVRVVEVHGWMDARTKNRITEFIESYPGVSFELLGPKELADLGLVERWYGEHNQARGITDFREWVFRYQQKTLES